MRCIQCCTVIFALHLQNFFLTAEAPHPQNSSFLSSYPHPTLHPASGSCRSIFPELDCCRHCVQAESHSMCPFVSDLLPLACCPQGSALLQHVSKCPSFLRLVFHHMHVLRRAYPHLLMLLSPLVIVNSTAMNIAV